MRQRKKLIFKVLKSFLIFLGVVFLIWATLLWFKSDFWRVKKIDCQLNTHDCPPELKTELMKLFWGRNIVFLSSEEAISEVKNGRFKLSETKIKKIFPNKLSFQLKQRLPKVAITIESSPQTEFYLVDQEGVLLEKTINPPNLPLIFVSQLPEIEAGRQIEQLELKKTIAILVDLQLLLLRPSLAKIVSPREIVVWLEDSLQATFSSKKDLAIQLDSLQLILNRTKIEGKKPTRVDLRFEKPVITYD